MIYQIYELTHALLAPWRSTMQVASLALSHPANPYAYTHGGKLMAAGCELFENLTRRYGKPEFAIDSVTVTDGTSVAVDEVVIEDLAFCQLKHFVRDQQALPSARRADPTVLVVAPLSGHYATLLRGTVKTLLADCDVYVTDWRDAREVTLHQGRFDLDDYIDYVLRFIRRLGPEVHVLAVCQPGPAVLAATALLASDGDPHQPASMTLMGSPIDSRKSPTVPNELAKARPLEWFEQRAIMRVPFPHAGFMRAVYPGFLQLTGFMTMNLDRHLDAHHKLFQHLVSGDGDSIAAHRKFYDEYLAVMDLPAEYYLQTLKVVFQEHQLALGTMTHRGHPVDLKAIRNTALMTVEGENDDISGIGQTQAAHELCSNIPSAQRVDHIQPGVGHYGVFNGARWRREIAPRIRRFIEDNRH